MTAPAEKYTLRIENTSPSDAPMHLMAEFIAEFSKMLGSKQHVHLQQVRDNCIALDAAIDAKGAKAVHLNIHRYRSENRSSYDRFDSLLRKHGNYAVLYDAMGNEKLEIPGIKRPAETQITLRQSTTVKGELVWIGGTSDSSIAHIDDGSGSTYKCQLPRSRAKQISGHLWDVFVVTGTANWLRDKNGKWSIQDYIQVKEIERLEDVALSESLSGLRKTMSEWSQADDVENLVARIRKGS